MELNLSRDVVNDDVVRFLLMKTLKFVRGLWRLW